LVPILPNITSGANDKKTRILYTQIEVGLLEYKRIYGQFPSDIMAADNDWGGSGGPRSLLWALQGPQGFGWRIEQHNVSREFGPYFDDLRGMVHRQGGAFADAFGNRIMYHDALMRNANSLSDSNSRRWRYWYRSAESHWTGANRDDDNVPLRNGGEAPTFYLDHWRQRLTQTTAEGIRIPYRPETFILWSAGEDRRLGYLKYNQSTRKRLWDLSGECDDLVNF
jgi:hypothetical protein